MPIAYTRSGKSGCRIPPAPIKTPERWSRWGRQNNFWRRSLRTRLNLVFGHHACLYLGTKMCCKLKSRISYLKETRQSSYSMSGIVTVAMVWATGMIVSSPQDSGMSETVNHLEDLNWTNRPPSRSKAQRTSGLSQTARCKLVSRNTLHGHRPHLQLAGYSYPLISQLSKCTWSDRSRAFERVQRGSIHAIRSMFQANAFTALINLLHPFSSPTLSTSVIYHGACRVTLNFISLHELKI